MGFFNFPTVKTKSFSLAATGDAVAAVTGKKIQVLAYKLVASATCTVAWADGSTALEGAQSLAPNEGEIEVMAPVAGMFLFQTTAGNALKLNIVGTATVAGRVTYLEA